MINLETKQGLLAVEYQFNDGGQLFKSEKREIQERLASRFYNLLDFTVGPKVMTAIGLPKRVEVTVASTEEKWYNAFATWKAGGERTVTFVSREAPGEIRNSVVIARKHPYVKNCTVSFISESDFDAELLGAKYEVWFDKEHTLGIVINRGASEPEGENVMRMPSGVFFVGNQTKLEDAFGNAFPLLNFSYLKNERINNSLTQKIKDLLFADLLRHQEAMKDRDAKRK